ncbi:MAG TPA: beta-ketoacyl synthase N-terminal-like domain-containing protein [Spirochaetota bacterium]|nr:beta-ketoacyl synthase N-terminal-like domain-containing protein [Spirochaetota bacterium]
MKEVFVRGRAITCSLGRDIEKIVSSVREKRVSPEQLPLSFGGTDYTRPYYRIRRENETFTDLSSEEYFYDVLNTTVGRALDDAGLSPAERKDCALFFGSTAIDIPLYENKYREAGPESGPIFSEESPGYGKIADTVARAFGLRGPCFTFTTACTSTANAMIHAAAMIRCGMIRRALVAGYDLYNDLGFFGFESLILITPGPYRPFDRNRKGIIMGEGCGAVVLDPKRGGSPFRILGGANLCDTNNVTTHDEEGPIIEKVIMQALKNSGLRPGEISAVKAHATGTVYNDRTEANGMKRAFGADMPPVTGIKPYIGHTVGAAGATELILVTECAARGFFPATPGFEELDEELGIAPLVEHMPFGRGSIMLNYFGFGGNCTSMVVANGD